MESAHGIFSAFEQAVSPPDDEIDLARAALAIARIEHTDLDPEPILARLDAMAAEVVGRAGPDAGPLVRLQALLQVVLREPELRGAREDFYNPANSFLNEVLERRVGLPIALSALLIAVGARAGIALGGTSMPMHFLVRAIDVRPPLFIDPYGGGQLLTEQACAQFVHLLSQGSIAYAPAMLDTVPTASILTRMLINLRFIYQRLDRSGRLLDVLSMLIMLAPDDPELLRDRGLLRRQAGEAEGARRDLQRYLEIHGGADDAEQIRLILQGLE
jgi:regulator of sirC expression with transglutaminase-like and TPR domain